MNRKLIMGYRSGLSWRVFVVVVVLVVGSLAGCDRGSRTDSKAVAEGPVDEQGAGVASGQVAAEQAEVAENVPREHYYSPFVIAVDSDVVFKTVTFEDVGIRQPDPGPVDDTLLEAIAESLAQKLSRSTSLGYSAKVYHDAAVADPANHLFCEESHLYVALWKGYSPDRWGYSLWSGCSDEHQFGWKEVLIPEGVKDDLVDSVMPLTASIVETLETATKKNCFVAEC